MNSQPSAKELNACDAFLRNVNALIARVSEQAAQYQGAYYVEFAKVIEAGGEAFKAVKNSSSSLTAYVVGVSDDARTAFELWQEAEANKKLLYEVGNNYRTLMASYRQERAEELKTHSQK